MKPALALLLGAALVLVPWLARSQYHFGAPLLSAIDGELALHYHAAGAIVCQESIPDSYAAAQGPYRAVRARLAEEEERWRAETRPSVIELRRWKLDKAAAIMAENRRGRLVCIAYSVAAHFGPSRPWWLHVPHLLVVYGGCALALACGGWRRPGALLVLLLVACLVWLASGPESYSRFRVPFMPLLCVVAVLGIDPPFTRWFPHWRASNRGQRASGG